MPRPNRSEQFVPNEICIVHAVQRCVRRAFLAGEDPVSGKNYEFRREWIRRRLELLAAVFGIDVLTYAILSNHLHVVLRNRPDVVATWSDEEVALRWLSLFPGRRLDEHLAEPTENDIKALVANQQRLEEVRTRLSDISWFMRSLSEPIARWANRQDECTGRFWEGRFKAQRITDEAGLLACAMYVDLNPIRAALAQSPETSRHTSAYDRIRGLKGERVPAAAAEVVPLTREQAAEQIKQAPAAERRRQSRREKARRPRRQILRDAWLAPLSFSKDDLGMDPQASKSGVRASDLGFLSLSVEEYLTLLDWTGRQGRRNAKGTSESATIPDHLTPIIDRLGIEGSMWCDLVWNFKRYFGRSAGSPASLQSEASRHGRQWCWGQRAAASCFATASASA